MTWSNCFSPKRYGLENPLKDVRTEYERDWDRIIFSSPFRRLQNKTQVFPLPEEVFVHNRLTHSLEVSSVGRSLGQIVGDKLADLEEMEKEAKEFYRNDLKNVIAAACLAHDLGNPAFGHSGEEAISKYFKEINAKESEDGPFRKNFSESEWKDLLNFEGNANALRIVTMKLNSRSEGGFRLTYSTMGSIIKYPCESLASEGKKGSKHRKKYGYFKIDEEVFLSIAKELNMIKEEVDSLIVYKRHPFVYLVEAADDICYNIIDFEDAHRLKILDFKKVKKGLMTIIKQDENYDKKKVKENLEILKGDKNETIAYLRAKAINTLISKCANVFLEKRELIIAGNYNNTLIEDIGELKPILRKISKKSYKFIYNARKVVELEIAGFRIMSRLVEDFVTAALADPSERNKEQQKIMELLPTQFKLQNEEKSAYEKVMRILDFISGMTDLFALKLYRKMRGIEI